MKVTMFIIALLLFTGSNAYSLGVNETSVRYDPKFYFDNKEYKNIVLLPAQVRLFLLSKSGEGERQEEEEVMISAELEVSILNELHSKKYYVISDKSNARGSRSLTTNRVDQIYTDFQGISERIKLRGKLPIEHVEFTDVTLNVSELNSNDADAYLYVDYHGYRKDSNFQNKDKLKSVLFTVATAALFGGHAAILSSRWAEAGMIRVAMFDSKNGSLLWANSNYSTISKGGFRAVNDRKHNASIKLDEGLMVKNILFPLKSNIDEKPFLVPEDYNALHEVAYEVDVANNLMSHKCNLQERVQKAFDYGASKSGMSVVENAKDTPFVKLFLEKVRDGKFATAKTKTRVYGNIYYNERLVGNFSNEENNNVFEGYAGVCARIDRSLKKTIVPLFEYIQKPAWDPVTHVTHVVYEKK